MRRLIIISSALLALSSQARAADSSVPGLPTNASAFGGSETMYIVQGAADRKGTPAQMATYVYGLASGDCTITSGGAITCLKTNGVAFGTAATVNTGTSGATIPLLNAANTWSAVQSFNANDLLLAGVTGSTQCLQASSSGVVTGTGAVCGGAGSSGANPTATASDTAVNGVAVTFLRSDGAPAIQKTSASVFGLVKVDGTTLTATAGVASVGTGCGLTTSSAGVIANATINAQVGTTYTVLSTDCGVFVSLNNASAIAVTLPQATGSFTTGWYSTFTNIGVGTVTITPTTSTIDGAASLTLKTNQSVDVISNGTNYITARGRPTSVACADLTNGTALCSTTPGTGVATAAAASLSAAGGLTSTIASGTSAMGTSAIASAACATVVTTSATNTATTDVVLASFNGDPTAVTGYIPATAGMLTIIAYPTANNVNFKACNNTSASITPGAITLNWRVVR